MKIASGSEVESTKVAPRLIEAIPDSKDNEYNFPESDRMTGLWQNTGETW